MVGDYFAELARRLAGEVPDTRLAVLGSGADEPLGRLITAAAPDHCLNLCGRTTLPEMIEWVRRSDLLITNDTGPMHVAAALGKPMVALFGPTEPRRTGPYGHLRDVLRVDLSCSPCLSPRCTSIRPQECLRAISPEAVLARVRERLQVGWKAGASGHYQTSMLRKPF